MIRPPHPPPETAFAVALASVPGLGPAELRRLLRDRSPSEAWRQLVERRRRSPASSDPALDVASVHRTWQAHRDRGVRVHVHGEATYPAPLADDEEAPAVLFALGDVAVADRWPRVGVVGTRSATRYGLGVAAQLGAELAGAGVAVVSGLALGIDGAAHEGACGASGAPPVAVVASGLDAPYPARHARLWSRVAEAGVVISEAPLGVRPEPWRFPRRNRIMAALCEVLVVVECHHTGGSLHTVRAAERRGVAVGVVPGSIRSPASAGTNDLLADGCFPVRDTTDVLVALELARAGAVEPPSSRRRRTAPVAPGAGPGPRARAQQAVTNPVGAGSLLPDGDGLDPTAAAVLDALGWEPCPLEAVLRATGLSAGEASAALERLSASGRARGEAGWWERSAATQGRRAPR